ncbi:MAG: alcohol dehydrogenase catalytic domain-containing protein, partial [Chloroflexi bacterium]|nr:alcohol dehydrogenase catalytic domain-containing protein [Chloroflexota bacterium]
MTNHDSSMRIAVFTGPRQVEVQQAARPVPGAGQALVRLRACGVCTMEQRLYLGVTTFYPVSPGHEPAGEVVAVGDGVVGIQPGDHVIVSFLPRCGQCYFCRNGESDKCTTRPARQSGQMFRIGGFGEYAVAWGYQLYKIDPGLDLAEASLGEPLACVAHSVNKLNLKFGEDVLIVGGGTMGQLHILLARLRGARVILSEPIEQKLRMGLEHGASLGINPLQQNLEEVISRCTDGRGVDALCITVGGGKVAEQALKSLRKGGRAIFYSAYYPPTTIGVDPDWVHHSQVSLLGAVNQTPEDWLQASQLLSKGLVNVKHLISGRFPLAAIDEAMKHATTGETFRIVV